MILGYKNTSGQWIQVGESNPLPVVATGGSTVNTAAFIRGLKAPAATGTPEALAADGTNVTTVTIWSQRASRVANTSSVYIDSTSGNDTQLIELAPGTFISITAPPGKVIDLNDIYVDSVTVTDGAFFLGLL